MYVYKPYRRYHFYNAINWWYLPVVACKLAGLAIVGAMCLLALTMPLWIAAGIVGLI